MNLKLDVSSTYIRNRDSKKKIKVNEGSSGSGKTFAILMVIIFDICSKNTGQIISIVREQYSYHRGSTLRDFIRILEMYKIFDPTKLKKSHPVTYTLNGNTIEFIGVDNADSVKSARRDYLYINEANKVPIDKWLQLSIRTRKDIYIDYNPSFQEHEWIDQVIADPDSDFIHSTYLNNYHFLEPQEIKRIEGMVKLSEYHDRVYRKGLRAVLEGQIFRYKTIKEIPEGAKYISSGMDFGFTNNPTALIDVYIWQDNLIWDQRIYETGLNNLDINERLKAIGFNRNNTIVADSSEPKSIDELKLHRWRVEGAKKGNDSKLHGINILLQYNILITSNSEQLKKEADNYCWKKSPDGKYINDPINGFNHGMDAARYVALNKIQRRKKKIAGYF